MAFRLIRQYFQSWAFAFKAWPYIILLWFVNFVLSLILVGPVSYGLKSAFGSSLELSNLIDSFNYTLIMDFLREYDIAVGAAFDQSVVIILITILVHVFLSGGIVHLIASAKEEFCFKEFWAYCSSLFIRFIGVAVLLMIMTGIMLFLLFSIFSKDGFNPFFLENEQVLINRFWWLTAIFILFLFWVSVFRDASKIEIYKNRESAFWKNILSGLRQSLKISFLFNGVLNALVYVVIFWLFFKIRPQLDLFGWVLILTSQLWLILRLSYRVARLRSFYQI